MPTGKIPPRPFGKGGHADFHGVRGIVNNVVVRHVALSPDGNASHIYRPIYSLIIRYFPPKALVITPLHSTGLPMSAQGGTAIVNHAPIVTTNNVKVNIGQSIAASDLVASVTDPDRQ